MKTETRNGVSAITRHVGVAWLIRRRKCRRKDNGALARNLYYSIAMKSAATASQWRKQPAAIAGAKRGQ